VYFAWPLGSVPGEIIYDLFTNYQWLFGALPDYRSSTIAYEISELILALAFPKAWKYPVRPVFGALPFNFVYFSA
jgi:hypothetical protein